MTETLADKTCTPCRGGVPPLAREEALRLQSQAPDWELRDDARRLERTFRLRNFQETLAFVQQAGELAESRNADDCSWAYSRRRSYCVLAANIRGDWVGIALISCTSITPLPPVGVVTVS